MGSDLQVRGRNMEKSKEKDGRHERCGLAWEWRWDEMG
jgi:hypothetical protein